MVDGNDLDETTDLAWSAADTLVWLDVPRRVGVVRSFARSVTRVGRRTPLWNGNRESPAVLAPRPMVRLIRRWPSYPARVESLLASDRFAHLRAARVRSSTDAEAFMGGTWT